MEKLYACAGKIGVVLAPMQLHQFAIYYQELVAWNERLNLTAITGPDEVQVKHFCDSLTPVLVFKSGIKNGNNLRVIDVGTGAGFPGMPLKISLPEMCLTLVESTAKKAVFLQHIKEKLALTGVEIVVGRAEAAARTGRYREKFDIVLSRAVAPLPALVELCLPFCAVGGRFIAQKKGDISAEVKQAAKAIKLMGGVLHEIEEIGLDEFPDKRCLVVIDKVVPTPYNFPRRSGMPEKNPVL